MKERYLKFPEPDVKTNTSEKLDVKIELATPDDWESYKELRILAITGKEKRMFGSTPKQIAIAKAKSEQEWKEDLSSDDMFVMLSKNGFEAVGMGWAKKWGKKEEERIWHMGSGYTKDDFRGKGFGIKNFASRLKNIIELGGKKVTMGVRAENKTSIGIAENFYFKTDDTIPIKLKKFFKISGFSMELDLTNPEVIKKIDEVLNER